MTFRVCMKCGISVLVVLCYDVKRDTWGAPRNNLIFNDVCIFRVGDPATLKMLNSFIVNQ